MHVLFSTVVGTPIVSDLDQVLLGRMTHMIVDPDTGAVLGLLVRTPGLLAGRELLLTARDILHWGHTIHVRDETALCPPEDIVRFRSRLSDPRTVLGQRIVTERTQRTIGRCTDVQFNTRTLVLEWLFPRAWFMRRRPIPVSEIVEVTPQAIIVHEPLKRSAKRAPAIIESSLLSEVVPVT